MVKIKAYTPEIVDKKGNALKNSITSLEEIEINGIKQSILIRGSNVNNPILLYLHGGPGCSEMGLFNHFNSELEKHFIIVNWDQRGTCKSYHSLDLLNKTINLEQFIKDIKTLVEILRKKFKKKKIYLVGHSWGTIIGMIFTQRHPNLVEKYIGISQVVNMVEADDIAYSFILHNAIKTNNKKAIKDLQSVNWLIPYVGYEYLDKVKVEAKWVYYYGGALHGEKNLLKLIKVFFRSTEYNLKDAINYNKGAKLSLEKLWKSMVKINFIKQIPELKVPVVFIQGKYDYQTPMILTRSYFDILKAPKKKIHIFNNSAHSPNYEENKKFNKIMIDLIKS